MMRKINWDGMGILTSVLCAIHCGLLPLVLPSLPLIGIESPENVFFEWLMIALAFAVGIFSLIHGYKTHHHRLMPLLLFSIGMMFLIAKQLFTDAEIPLLLVAIALIISAHYINFRLCKKSACASPHHRH